MTDWDQWKFYLDLAQSAAVVIMWLWMFLDRGRSRNSDAINKIEGDVGALDRRVLSLENKAATHDDIAQLRAEMEGMKATLSQVDQVVSRIYSYLLNNKGEQ